LKRKKKGGGRKKPTPTKGERKERKKKKEKKTNAHRLENFDEFGVCSGMPRGRKPGGEKRAFKHQQIRSPRRGRESRGKGGRGKKE